MVKSLWSGERINPFVRALAWAFIICGILSFSSIIYLKILNEEPLIVKTNFTEFVTQCFDFLVGLYIFSLFLKVAVTGFAPSSWLPWR